MDRIQDPTATADDKFQEASGAIPATRLRAPWLNGVQEELLHIIEEEGLLPSGADLTQVLAALDRRFPRRRNAVTKVATITELLALTVLVDGQRVSVTEYFSGIAGGHSEYYWDAARPKSDHTGASVISPTVPWDGSVASLGDFQDGTGETDPGGNGCWVSLAEVDRASDWGISPENPDNLPALLNFIDKSSYPDNSGRPVCPPLFFDHGEYTFSGTVQLKARVALFGQRGEKGNSIGGTEFHFPAESGDGFIVHRNDTINNGETESPATGGADGSVIDGVTLIGSGGGSDAAIYDYDLSKMLMVYRGTLQGSDFDAYDINNPNYEASVIATFSISGASVSCTPLPVATTSGTFVENETITGGTSGATANVVYASSKYSVLLFDNRVGTFEEGETVTGGTSGAIGITVATMQGGGFYCVGLSSASGPLTSGDAAVSLTKPQGQYGSAITMFAAAKIQNCRIVNWKEHGVKIPTSSGAYPSVGNANRWLLSSVWVDACGGHGFLVSGGDSNAGMGIDLNAIGCGGYGFNDQSFLGNTWLRCHTAHNNVGAYKSDNNVSRNSNFTDCYSEQGIKRYPYPEYASPISGATITVGGTQAAPVIPTADYSDAPNGYVNLNPRYNFNFRGLEYGPIGSNLAGAKLKVRTQSGNLARAIEIENNGNYGPARGVGIAFRTPHENLSSLECAMLAAHSDSPSAELRTLLREGGSRGQYATISGGTGAALELVVESGVVTDVIVLRSGSGYSFSDTITISGPAGGSGADFVPVIADGRLINVVVVSGGSGYTDTAPQERWAVRWDNAGPSNDNVMSAGTAAERYSEVYAGTGTINTSDANEKQQVRPLDEAEQAVAQACKSLIRAYKFNDAVERKGDDARIHIGVIAQDVEQAFIEEGLNPSMYAMFCRDTWWEVNGQPASEDDEGAVQRERLGIRYDELLAFIIGAL